jgi:hypothetical protein
MRREGERGRGRERQMERGIEREREGARERETNAKSHANNRVESRNAHHEYIAHFTSQVSSGVHKVVLVA